MAYPGTHDPDDPGDALALLRADHERIRQLFSALGRLRGEDDALDALDDNERRAGLIDDICYELTVHGMLEDELFYPTLRTASGDDELLDDAEETHAGIRELVAQLDVIYPGDEHFDATVAVLADEVLHHLAHEESEMFDAARTAGVDTTRLGRLLAARRREIDEDLDPTSGIIDAMEPHAGMRTVPRAPD